MSYSPIVITGEQRHEDMQSRNVLEKQIVNTIKSNATPNVLNRKFFELINTGANVITDFINGAPGQRIYLLGDGFTTLEHGTFIFTNTGVDKLLLADIVYKLTFFEIDGSPKSHKWVEDE